MVGSFFREWLSDIERREGHEDISLEERDEEFEEPEWNRHDSKESSGVLRKYHFSNIDHHRDEDRANKNIEKETHREWADTDKLSSKVKPTDKYADILLSDSISVEVE